MTCATPLVRGGQDAKLPVGKDGEPNHNLLNVHREMLLQICRDYSTLPDPRTLRFSEIRWYYEGLRGELKQHTKARGGKSGR